MFLKYLHLTNVRCFAEAEIDFDLPGADNRKWTIIVGENGDGKTTILQSIALVMAGKDAMKALLKDVDNWIRDGEDQAIIAAGFETKSGKDRNISLVMNRGETPDDVINRSEETAERLNAALKHGQRSWPVIAYGSARRQSLDPEAVAEGRRRYPQPRSHTLARIFDQTVPLLPLESWVVDLVDGDAKKYFKLVGDLIEEFLPEIKFQKITDDRRILFETADGVVPLERLSSGYQSLNAFLGDLIYQVAFIFKDRKDPLGVRGLLLVDSIALELHPKLQRRLVDFLTRRFPNLQLIVSTQSIIIAQQSPPEALHYCRRGENGVEIVQFEGEPQRFRLNQLMMTEAFGDSTFESLEMEVKKDRFRALSSKPDLTDDERAEMEAIGRAVGDLDPMGMSEKQEQLLQDVHAALADLAK